jgi:hypothetical protein
MIRCGDLVEKSHVVERGSFAGYGLVQSLLHVNYERKVKKVVRMRYHVNDCVALRVMLGRPCSKAAQRVKEVNFVLLIPS